MSLTYKDIYSTTYLKSDTSYVVDRLLEQDKLSYLLNSSKYTETRDLIERAITDTSAIATFLWTARVCKDGEQASSFLSLSQLKAVEKMLSTIIDAKGQGKDAQDSLASLESIRKGILGDEASGFRQALCESYWIDNRTESEARHEYIYQAFLGSSTYQELDRQNTILKDEAKKRKTLWIVGGGVALVGIAIFAYSKKQ